MNAWFFWEKKGKEELQKKMRDTFLKIDHTDSYQDFGEQFLVDSKIDGYWGSQELLSDIVKPFDLKKIEGSKVMEVGCGSGRILKSLLEYRPKNFSRLNPLKQLMLRRKIIKPEK